MNLKTTLQTLRHIERLLDGWQSSGDIPVIERDLACDLLRRAYDDIFFSDNYAATVSEVSLAENTPADRMNGKAVGESAGIPVDAVAAAGDALVADVVSSNGLVRPAPTGEPAGGMPEEPAEEMPEEWPENAEAVAAPAAENALEVPAESPVEGNASVETPAEGAVSVEESAEKRVSIGMPVGEPVGADTLVEVSIEEPVSVEEPDEESVPVEEFIEEPIGADTLIEVSIEEPVSVGEPVDEPASIETSVVKPASVEESVEEHVPIETSVGAPVGEDTPVEVPVGGIVEEEIPVEEFGEAGGAGDVAEESGDTVSPAEDVATSIPETSVDVVIDPVFEVFADEGEDAGEPDGTEEQEEAEVAEIVDLAGAVNVAGAVEAAGAVEDTEITEDTEVEQSLAASAAMQSVTAVVEPVATTAEPAAEPGPESVSAPAPTSAPAETSAGEARADAVASNAETLEEMAARFKNASGRRRRSRRAFLSLYDDDETARRGGRNDQLELSDWGVEPSDPSAKLRHARELFGLPVDDLDTASEPTPQPADESATVAEPAAADGEIEIEVIDFLGDDNLLQRDRNAKPAAEPPIRPATETTSEPMAAPTQPTQPTPRPTVAPVREERDDADDDLPFDEAVVALEDPDAPAVPPLEVSEPLEHPESPESPESPGRPESPDTDAVPFESIEIVEIADGDEETSGIEEDETQHTDRAEVVGEPARAEIATPAASATEPAAVHTLYGREEKPELPASTTVLGEVMGHDVPTVGDSLGRRPDVAGWTDVSDDLNRAISVGDRFVLLRDLFDGDQALCDRTLKRLSTFDDLDDCMIWITENFAWNANSEGAKLIMGLLERKLG